MEGPEKSFRSNYPALGTQMVKTPRGPIQTIDAPGAYTGVVTRPSGNSSVMLMLYDPEPGPDGTGLGMITQLTPEAAREFAASLLEQAEKVAPMVRN